MSNFFEQFDEDKDPKNYFEQFETEQQVVAPQDEGSAILDLVSAWGVGSGNLVNAAGSLYGLATGNMDNAATRLGGVVTNYWKESKSDVLKELEAGRDKAINSADGEAGKFGAAIWETVSNPRLLGSFVAEQAPMLVPGFGGAKGAAAVASVAGAKKAGQIVAGTVGATGVGAALQGGDIGGSTYEEIKSLPNIVWEQNPDYTSLREDIGSQEAKEQIALKYGRAAGVLAAGISAGAQFIPGGAIIEKSMAGKKFSGGLMGNTVKGALGEGFQEISEEGGGQLLSNLGVQQVDESKSLTEGLGQSAGLGLLGGATMGSVFGAITPRENIAGNKRLFENRIEEIRQAGLAAEQRGESPEFIAAIKSELDALKAQYNAYLAENDKDYVAGKSAEQQMAREESANQGGDALDQEVAATKIASELPNAVSQQVQSNRDLDTPTYVRQQGGPQADAGLMGDNLIQRDQVALNQVQPWAPNWTNPDQQPQQTETIDVDGEFISKNDYPDSIPPGNTLGFDDRVGAIDATPENRINDSGTVFSENPNQPIVPGNAIEDKGIVFGDDRTREIDARERAQELGNQPRQIEQKDIVFADDQSILEGGADAKVRANGNTFKTAKSVQAAKSFKDAEKAGENPVVVRVGDGYGWEKDNAASDTQRDQPSLPREDTDRESGTGVGVPQPEQSFNESDNTGTASDGTAQDIPVGDGRNEDGSTLAIAQEEQTETADNKLAVVEAPLSELSLSKDVPQFKSGSSSDGVVERLEGTFDRTGTGPIQVWVRNDGRKEVITGRHRFDLAKRSGETTIPVQYHYERNGFDKHDASSMDAILNIRDGQGKVKDYVQYFRYTKTTEQAAKSEGLLGRSLGKRAYAIADGGSEAVISQHSNDQISDEAAYRIATAAPNNDSLQAVGIKALQDGKTIAVAENMMRAVSSMTGGNQSTGDLFGMDDSALVEAEQMARHAASKQTDLRKRLTAIRGAAKNPKVAKQEGVDIRDENALNSRIEQLSNEVNRWDSWHTDPAMVAEIRSELGLSDFNLDQETEQQRFDREQSEKSATNQQNAELNEQQQRAEADRDVDDFNLSGSDRSADIAASGGQGPLFRAGGNTAAADNPTISRADADEVVSRITADWRGGGGVEVVSSFDELPDTVKNAAKEQGVEGQVKGVFHEGKTYVVVDKHADSIDVETTIFHEAYGHEGLRKVFGKELSQILNQLFVANGGLSGLRKAAKKHGINLEQYITGLAKTKLTQEQQNKILMEELLAHMQQDNRPGVKRLAREAIGFIRNALRKMGLKSLSTTSDSDLFYILRQARKAVQNGDGQTFVMDNGTPVFSKSQKGNSIDNILNSDRFADDLANDADKKAFSDYMDTRDDKDIVVSRINNLIDTPWAKQTIRGAMARKAIEDLSDGIDPDYSNPISRTDKNGKHSKLYKALKAYGVEGAWDYIAATNIIGNPEKASNAINGSFLDCNPSKACAKYCYATKGNYNYASSVSKSELVAWAIESDPERAAKIAANRYKATPEYDAQKALRLFDKGDINESWLPFIDHLNKKGIRVQIFSKNPEVLRRVNDMNVKMLSVDETNMQIGIDNPDLNLAVVYDGGQVLTEFILDNVDRLSVILPVKVGQKVLEKSELSAILGNKEAKKKLCPIDSGFKKIKEWNCTKCDKNGGIGCFHKSVTKDAMEAAVGEPSDIDKILEQLNVNASRMGGTGRAELLTKLGSLIQTVREYDVTGTDRSEIGSTGGSAAGRAGGKRQAKKPLGDIAVQQVDPNGNPLFRLEDNNNFTLPEETFSEKYIRILQDKFRPLKKLQQSIESTRGSKLSKDQDTYQAEELFHGKTENDLVNIEEKFVQPLVDSLSKEGIELAELDQFLMARHAEERNAHIAAKNEAMPDGGSGMTNAEAEAILDGYKREGKLGKLSIAAEKVYAITKERIRVVREAGLESDELLDTWDAGFEYYVPLKGFANDEEGSQRPRTGTGFDIRGKESMQAMGRRTMAESPISHAIQDLTTTIIRKRKNEVGQTFLNLVEANPSFDMWEVFTDKNPDTERRMVDGEVRDGQPVQMRMRKDDYFSVKRDGKEHFIKIKGNDKRVLEAMKNLGPQQMGKITQTMSAVTRWLSMVNTSLNPEFTITNFTRDIQTALFNALAEQDLTDGKVKDKAIATKMVKGAPKAGRALWKHSRGTIEDSDPMKAYVDEFLADGAKTGYFDSKDIDQIGKDISGLLDMSKSNFKGNLLKSKKKITDFIEHANGAVENGVRLSSYIEARKAGVSRDKAASFAKNLTVNFNRKGELGQVMNSLYMFFNAAIQGNANFARAIITPVTDPVTGKKKMNTAQKAAAGITATAAMFAYASREMGGEDDDGVAYWDKIPKGVRERNLVILKSLYGGDPEEYWTIPLPYGYNIFYNMGDAAEAFINSDTRKAGDLMGEMALSAYASFIPLGTPVGDNLAESLLLAGAPTVTKPAVELTVNKNFFGGQIYRENSPYGPQKADAEMSMRSTKEVYKSIATFMNDVTGGSTYIEGSLDFSPDSIEHLVEFSLGGLYRFADRTLNVAVKGTGDVPIEATDIPFVRKTTGVIRPYQDMSDFYDARQELKNLEAERKALKGQDRIDFMDEYRAKMRLKGLMSSTDKRMKMLRKRRDRVESDDTLTPRQKDAELQKIEDLMEKTVDKFNSKWLKAS